MTVIWESFQYCLLFDHTHQGTYMYLRNIRYYLTISIKISYLRNTWPHQSRSLFWEHSTLLDYTQHHHPLPWHKGQFNVSYLQFDHNYHHLIYLPDTIKGHFNITYCLTTPTIISCQTQLRVISILLTVWSHLLISHVHLPGKWDRMPWLQWAQWHRLSPC